MIEHVNELIKELTGKRYLNVQQLPYQRDRCSFAVCDASNGEVIYPVTFQTVLIALQANLLWFCNSDDQNRIYLLNRDNQMVQALIGKQVEK